VGIVNQKQKDFENRRIGSNLGVLTGALASGVSSIPFMIGEGHGPHPHIEAMIAEAKKKWPTLEVVPTPSYYSSFNPQHNVVRYGGAATLGHELGHVAIHEKIQKMKMAKPYLAARFLGIGVAPIGSALYSAASSDDKSAKNVALGATALGGLTVADEAAASAIGIKNIIKHQGGVGKFLTSKTMPKTLAMLASGLGTYVATSSIPLLAYHFSRAYKNAKK
jgi:hypothetical protein